MYVYYRQRKDIESILGDEPPISRTNYVRILALASIDLLLTLPLGVATLVLKLVVWLRVYPLPFYSGWKSLHAEWEPIRYPYKQNEAYGKVALVELYVAMWTPPTLALAVFALFGLSAEARASYWRIACTIRSWFGTKRTPISDGHSKQPGDVELDGHLQVTTEVGSADVDLSRYISYFSHVEGRLMQY